MLCAETRHGIDRYVRLLFSFSSCFTSVWSNSKLFIFITLYDTQIDRRCFYDE
jgi:hypothetical protein